MNVQVPLGRLPVGQRQRKKKNNKDYWAQCRERGHRAVGGSVLGAMPVGECGSPLDFCTLARADRKVITIPECPVVGEVKKLGKSRNFWQKVGIFCQKVGKGRNFFSCKGQI